MRDFASNKPLSTSTIDDPAAIVSDFSSLQVAISDPGDHGRDNERIRPATQSDSTRHAVSVDEAAVALLTGKGAGS